MELKLGQTVEFSNYVELQHLFVGRRRDMEWYRFSLGEKRKGIVVGLRLISDQVVDILYPTYPNTEQANRAAALVAYDLHRNPKLVLLSDLIIKTD